MARRARALRQLAPAAPVVPEGMEDRTDAVTRVILAAGDQERAGRAWLGAGMPGKTEQWVLTAQVDELIASLEVVDAEVVEEPTDEADTSRGQATHTDVQGTAIHPGMSDSAAFAALGGKAVSGSIGAQAGPVLGYEYPVKGTGNPDDVVDTKTIWWEICVGFGRVTNTYRGTMDSGLPARCPDPGR